MIIGRGEAEMSTVMTSVGTRSLGYAGKLQNFLPEISSKSFEFRKFKDLATQFIVSTTDRRHVV